MRVDDVRYRNLERELPLATGKATLRLEPGMSVHGVVRRADGGPVAGVAVTAAARDAFRRIMAQNFELITIFNVGFAVIIAFGVVYNAARISLSERSRELASLRVLGFTIAEISLILLEELALLTLVAIPPGLVVGRGLSMFVLLSFSSEVYRIPLVITPPNVAWSILTVVAAATVSGVSIAVPVAWL